MLPGVTKPIPTLPTVRRAKIVCTIGPAVATEEGIRDLVDAGMDVARLNFSHGTHQEHSAAIRLIRAASDESGRAVCVLGDLQGPKIRLGNFAEDRVEWLPGELVTITTEDVVGTAARVSTTYARFADEVTIGQDVLIDDGRLLLTVEEIVGPDVRCRVIEGGPVSNHKGISIPGAALSLEALTQKDVRDLIFGLRMGIDMVALSFVRSPDDIGAVHAVMRGAGAERLPVIAKLEMPEAVARLDEIITAFDGVMVARGDLGVELPLEEVPIVQKRAIDRCRVMAKPVIVATQMLDSMVTEPRPTRAEASDVANAVLDGADALMLSAETSVGKHPIDAVKVMARIISSVEHSERRAPALRSEPSTKPGAIAAAAVRIGETLDVRAIVPFTQTGDTARRISRHHPSFPILAFTPMPRVRSQLALTWGVETFLLPPVTHTDQMVREVDRALLSIRRFAPGEEIVIVAGSPPGTAGTTNALRVWTMGGPLPQ